MARALDLLSVLSSRTNPTLGASFFLGKIFDLTGNLITIECRLDK
jgi:hypothetical protein